MKWPKMLGLIVLAAVVIRIALFAVLDMRDDPRTFYLPDTVWYVQIASNLIDGHGFSQATSSPYAPDGMRTPGLPFLLAATLAVTGSVLPYVILQICMSAGIVLLSYLIARRATGSEKVALAVAALAALEPYSIFISLTVLTETVFTVVLLSAVYSWCVYVDTRSLKAIAIAGALFGVSALIRPITEFVPVVLALYLVLDRRDWKSAGIAVSVASACFMLAVSPWIIRNYITFGSAALSSGGFQNVYSDLGATVVSFDQGTPWYKAKRALESSFIDRHDIKPSELQGNPKVSKELFGEGVRLFFTHPVAAAKSILTVCIAFFTNDAWSYYLQKWGWMRRYELGFSPTYTLLSEGPIYTARRVTEVTGPTLAIPLIGRLFWLGVSALFFLGTASMYLRGGRTRVYGLVFLSLVVYLLVLCVSNGSGINGRYRYPVNTLVFVGACAAAANIYAIIRKKFAR